MFGQCMEFPSAYSFLSLEKKIEAKAREMFKFWIARMYSFKIVAQNKIFIFSGQPNPEIIWSISPYEVKTLNQY